ncbi:MAG: flagellar hook-length control protein FliK [Ignavibacteriaceae bacterium]
MLFNPLFMQSTGLVNASSSFKQSKLSSPTYLFSDIIKIINKNTFGDTSVTASSDSLDLPKTSNSDTNTTDTMTQLLDLAKDNQGVDNMNVSLNNLLKNLLISSNSSLINDSGDVEASSNNNSSTNAFSLTTQKNNVENLLQNISAALSKLNISSDSLKQVQSGISGSNLKSKVIKNLNQTLNSTSKSNDPATELVFNLQDDSKLLETSKDGVPNQSSNLSSVYTALTSILTNFNSDNSSKTSATLSSGSSKIVSKNHQVSPEAEQLAASLINLYQNNKNLVLNVNSGSDNVKINISSGSTNSDQTNKISVGSAQNVHRKADYSNKTEQQTVSEKTSDSGKANNTPDEAEVATETKSNAIYTDIKNIEEMSKSFVASLQSDKTSIAKNNITTVSDQNNSLGSDSTNIKSGILKTEDNVTITVSTNLNNEGANNTNLKLIDDTVTRTLISSRSNIKISDGNETNNTDLSAGNQVKTFAFNETKTDTKNNTIISVNSDTKSANNSEVKVVNGTNVKVNSNKWVENTELKVNTDKPVENTELKVTTDKPLENTELKITTNKLAENTELKVSLDKSVQNTELNEYSTNPVENTEQNIKSLSGSENYVKSSSNLSVKAKNNIKNAEIDSEESNTAHIVNNKAINVKLNDSSNQVMKESTVQDNQKATQINQTNIVDHKPDDTSIKSTDDTTSGKQDSSGTVVQVAGNSQGNSFNDQQQKKSSEGNKSTDSKIVGQVTIDFSIQTTDSVKEKSFSQSLTTDSPEKTIKITEITKEISDLVQQNNSKSVVLQLKPESLGKIKVTVDVNNNTVNARVEVDTEAVRQIVQNNTIELRQSLNSNGMQLNSLSVNVSSGEQKPYQSSLQKKKLGYQTSSKRIEDNSSLASSKSMGYNTYEYLI